MIKLSRRSSLELEAAAKRKSDAERAREARRAGVRAVKKPPTGSAAPRMSLELSDELQALRVCRTELPAHQRRGAKPKSPVESLPRPVQSRKIKGSASSASLAEIEAALASGEAVLAGDYSSVDLSEARVATLEQRALRAHGGARVQCQATSTLTQAERRAKLAASSSAPRLDSVPQRLNSVNTIEERPNPAIAPSVQAKEMGARDASPELVPSKARGAGRKARVEAASLRANPVPQRAPSPPRGRLDMKGPPPPKRKPKAPSGLAAMRPTNEAEERAKFVAALARGEPYNPKFRYADLVKAERARASCDRHLSGEFGEAALSILRGVLEEHGSEAAYCERCWGRELEREEVQAACEKYVHENGLGGKVTFEFDPETLVTYCAGSTIHLVARPHYYREIRLASLLDHEVGTHFLRSHNHRNAMALYGAGFQHRDGWLLATEEGLATLNTNRLYKDKRLWVPALHYHSALLASTLSFCELWAELAPLLGTCDVEERLWTTCLRVKRGMTDTGRAGGFYKDQANFSGAMRLLRDRDSIDFPLLHCVRVSIEDFPRAAEHASRALQVGAVAMPHFVRDEPAYRATLDEMAAANGVVAPEPPSADEVAPSEEGSPRPPDPLADDPDAPDMSARLDRKRGGFYRFRAAPKLADDG